MKNAAARTEQIIDQPARVRALRKVVETTADGIWPAIELSRPYIDGTERKSPQLLPQEAAQVVHDAIESYCPQYDR